MPISPGLRPIDIVDICDAARAGKTRAEIADELDISEGPVRKYSLHIPDGSKRDIARAGILDRADAGDSLDAIASLEACSIRFVATVLRARHLEERARAVLDTYVPPEPKKRWTFDEVHALRRELEALNPAIDVRPFSASQLQVQIRKEKVFARWATWKGTQKDFARELGENAGTLRKWLRKAEKAKGQVTPPPPGPLGETTPPEKA